MKTVKLFATLLMVVLCVGITSCSKDDDKSEASITGTWVMTKWIEGEDIWTPAKGTEMTQTFNSDGSYSYAGTDRGDTFSGKGKYSYNSAKKTFTSLDDGENITLLNTVILLTPDLLVFSYHADGEDYNEIHFTRK
jgi:hypothetical protein